jgi:hypothetical protein
LMLAATKYAPLGVALDEPISRGESVADWIMSKD